MERSARRPLLVSKGWIQAVVLVVLSGSSSSACSPTARTWRTRRCPSACVDAQGRVLYTGTDISKGQQVFLHNGLMEYGSAFGHGAYLGPDFTADYLRRASDLVKRSYGGTASDSAARRTIEDFRTNRYDKRTKTLTLTAPQAQAFRALVPYYSRFFSDPTTKHGLRPKAITDPTQLRQLTAFFAWTAWAASTNRPGHDYSYTNNWPSEPRVDNKPTAERDRVVGAVADRAARRHRPALRRLRALGAAAGMARPRAGDAVVPRPGRRRAHARPARVRVVLLRDGGAVPAADPRRRRVAALPRRDRRVLRLRPGEGLPLQPDAHLARPARAVLGGHLVRRGRHLPRADDRPARAHAIRARWPSRCSARSPWSCSGR